MIQMPLELAYQNGMQIIAAAINQCLTSEELLLPPFLVVDMVEKLLEETKIVAEHARQQNIAAYQAALAPQNTSIENLEEQV